MSDSPLSFFDSPHTPETDLSGPGVPNLLNPVRILAQTGSHRSATLDHSQIVTSAISGRYSNSTKENSGPLRSLYEARCEPLSVTDPIANRHVSYADAYESFAFFMNHINPIITMMDPLLHTFEYVKQHGTLLTSICLVSTWHHASTSSSGIAQRLQRHLLHQCRPLILLDGYCSTEIVIAFTLYASFHPCTDNVVEDRSWSMLGDAIKLSTELDLHSKVVSKHLDVADEMEHRHARARER